MLMLKYTVSDTTIQLPVNNWTVTKPPLTNKNKKDFPNAASGKPGSLEPVRTQAREL